MNTKPNLKIISGGLDSAMKREFSSPKHRAWLSNLDQEYGRLVRRLNLLRSLKNGDAGVKRIKVKESGWVKRHKRRAHTRFMIVKNKEAK